MRPSRKTRQVESLVEKTYRVVSHKRVAGHSRGELVKLTLSRSREDSLIQAGHLEVVMPQPKEDDSKPTVQVSKAPANKKKGKSLNG